MIKNALFTMLAAFTLFATCAQPALAWGKKIRSYEVSCKLWENGAMEEDGYVEKFFSIPNRNELNSVEIKVSGEKYELSTQTATVGAIGLTASFVMSPIGDRNPQHSLYQIFGTNAGLSLKNGPSFRCDTIEHY